MIATVTLNPAVDQTVRTDEPLEPDAVTRVDDARFDPGGKGINVSQFLTAMGTETVATGVLGGFLGEYVTDTLADAGIATRFVDIEGGTRLNTTVHTPDGEFKLNQRGPAVESADIGRVLDVLAGLDPDTVVVAGSLPPGLDASAIDRLADAGAWDTVVDVDGPMLSSLSAEYALCKPNAPELEAATGRDIETVEDAVGAARELQAQGFDRVLASLGPDGAVLVTADDAVHEPAVECEVVDTVGAGDAMLSGYLAARAAGSDDERALRTGSLAAAAAVTTVGTTVEGLPDPAAVEQ